ncbi:MAG: hypothetical protein M5U26_16825 [Planctomycetota bacterium]|nr:hypothetical protein [Planctomycetota bacterium]
MALTAEQTTQIFEMLGIPEGGNGAVLSSVATLFGPAYESYEMSGFVDLVNARLAGLSASQEARVGELLARWSAIGATSPLTVAAEGAARGTLADHPAERAHLRLALANVIGIAVSSGGFAREAWTAGGGGARVAR